MADPTLQASPDAITQNVPAVEVSALPLRDIISPPEPTFWPPALGWWLVLASVLLFVWWFVKYLRGKFTPKSPSDKRLISQTALRKLALSELADIQSQTETSPLQKLAAVSALLKRTAVQRFPEQSVASLTGEQWTTLLDSRLADKPFSQLGVQSDITDGAMLSAYIFDAHYQNKPQIDEQGLFLAAQKWIESL